MGLGKGQWTISKIRQDPVEKLSHFPLLLCTRTLQTKIFHVLFHSSAFILSSSSLYHVFTAGYLLQPASWLNSERTIELGRTVAHNTGDESTLIFFLGLRVAVTGTRLLHLCDSYESTNSYRGCGKKKQKDRADWMSSSKDKCTKKLGSKLQEVSSRLEF